MKSERNLHLMVGIGVSLACLLLLCLSAVLLMSLPGGRQAAAATPPAVSIVTPAHGTQVGIGAPVVVQVRADSPDSLLVRLQLWADGQLAGDMPAMSSRTQAVWVWTPQTPGDHTLTAYAYDRQGRSAVASVRVQAVQAADRDGDGVPDEQDACPDQAGMLQSQGCTMVTGGDRDGDGVQDSQDQSPDDFGLAENGGSPQLADRDGDGIADGEDRCPDQAGPFEGQGCPDPGRNDSDGDGVEDAQDQCDDQPGAPGSLGCPSESGDRDGDGVADDQCPDLAGPGENEGCPLVDSDDQDGDGIPDGQDECPVAPGSGDGCPNMEDIARAQQGTRILLCNLSRLWGIRSPACADSDGDGVLDADDRCPNEAGRAGWGGCSSLIPGGSIIREGPSPLWCALRPSTCTDSDGDGVMDADDGCPQSPGDILGCPGFLEYEGPAVGPPMDVEIRMGQRLYTDQDWVGVFCYLEVEGLTPARLPWEGQSLEKEGPSVWNLGEHRSLDLTTEEVVLRLSLQCYGTPDRVGPPVDLGRVVRDHPRDDWNGENRQATSEGAGHNFTLYYQICRSSCR